MIMVDKPVPTLLYCIMKVLFLDRQGCFNVFIFILYMFFMFKLVIDVVVL